ncbi:dual specificity protein phosphatase 10-like [Diadema antillarum]|uniref:dual specificity protein phosphatase 10-like n=1 Tax=Diadema antillarum TaxID=105358 RepID=UPI003A88BAD5
MSPDASSRSTSVQLCSPLVSTNKEPAAQSKTDIFAFSETSPPTIPPSLETDTTNDPVAYQIMASPFSYSSSAFCASALKAGSGGSKASEHKGLLATRSSASMLSIASDKLQCHSPRLRCKMDNRNLNQVASTAAVPSGNTPVVLPQELLKRLDSYSMSLQAPRLATHGHLGTRSMILVDIRPFLAFSRRHISGALNVNCASRFSCRRLREGKLSLVDLVTSEEGKLEFQRRLEDGKEVVVYDEDTQGMESLPVNHPTSLVIKALRKEGVNVRLLKGGIKEFLNHSESQCVSELRNTISATSSSTSSQDPKHGEEPPSPTSDSENLLRGGSACPSEGIPMTQILPHLYVGNEVDAGNLDELRHHGIGYVLNVTNTVPCFHEGESAMHYLRIPVRDNGLINLRCHFQKAYDFIDEARRRNARVLVHCHAGISRSSTITIAYVMKYMNQSMTQAYQFVKNKRPIIAPNLGFVGQLMEFEQGLKLAAQRVVGRGLAETPPANCAKQLHQSRPSTPIVEMDTGLSEA